MGAAFAAGALAGLRSLGQAQQARDQEQFNQMRLASGLEEAKQNKISADLLGQVIQSPDFQKMAPIQKLAFIRDPSQLLEWQRGQNLASTLDKLSASATEPTAKNAYRLAAQMSRQGDLAGAQALLSKALSPDKYTQAMQSTMGQWAGTLAMFPQLGQSLGISMNAASPQAAAASPTTAPAASASTTSTGASTTAVEDIKSPSELPKGEKPIEQGTSADGKWQFFAYADGSIYRMPVP